MMSSFQALKVAAPVSGLSRASGPRAPRGMAISVAFQHHARLSPALSRRGASLAVRAASGAGAGDALASGIAGGIATDANVPEGHKGLHGALYGDGGAEAHDSGSAGYTVRREDDDGESILPIEHWVSSRDGEAPVGVYAVYDSTRELQYVGYSRNVVKAIKGHIAIIPDQCAYVRFMVFANKSMATRQNLETEANNWIDSNGTTPSGNGADKDVWEASQRGVAATDASYMDTKLKLRKAMGENLADDVDGETMDARTRRLNLLKAVEGDDWSGEIDAQTKATIDGEAEGPPVVSPFTQSGVHRELGEGNAELWDVDMDMDNVDKALEEVRPYLIADGGNVEVVFIDKGIVALRLQGACGTCPSSTATMKMGIETTLKKRFGDKLVRVVQVEKKETGASTEAVNLHLDVLRGAIENYGGAVNVVSLEGDTCTLQFRGPPPIRMGIEAAIKDKFPDIKKVVMEDYPEDA